MIGIRKKLEQNEFRISLGNQLQRRSKKSNQRLWKDASEAVLASGKNRPTVNVSEISRNSKEGSKVVVPGKVLGLGSIDHKVTVAAYAFSEGARAKILASGGNCLSISEFMSASSTVKDVLLLG